MDCAGGYGPIVPKLWVSTSVPAGCWMCNTTSGRMAVAMDPAGAVFGIWQARAFPRGANCERARAMRWNEQMSRDGLSYAIFKVDGRDVGGIGGCHAGVAADTPAGWRVYFGAADTGALVAQVRAHSGSVIFEPIDHPYGHLSTVADD